MRGCIGQTIQSLKKSLEVRVTMNRPRWGLLAVLVFGFGVVGAHAQAASEAMLEFYKAHYVKHEYRIPMRDGVKLYTQVYTPVSGQVEDKGPYPFLMTRTPYSCGNYDNAVVQPKVTGNMTMLKAGYILVCQDVRGRWESEG